MEQILSKNSNINQIADFYANPDAKICFVEGEEGSFKTFFVNESLKTTNSPVFKLKCFENTTLDDIFLLLLEDIKKFAKENKISFVKVETKDISKKINHYLSHLSVPSIIVIDSMENLFNKSEKKDKEEIFRYIECLSSLKSFKFVFISTNFPQNFNEIFIDKTFSTTKIQMQPLTKDEIIKLFEQEKIDFDNENIEKFFEISQGSPDYVFIAANIMSTLNIGLQNLLNAFHTKQISLKDYLCQKIITFIPDNAKNAMIMLSFFNGGLCESYLISSGLFTKEQISYLLEKRLIIKEFGLIFVKDYVKKQLQKSVNNLEKVKFYEFWANFYNSQLPLPPSERAVLISRNTMRAQIEYYKTFVAENKKNPDSKTDMSLVSYLNSDMTAWNYPKTNSKKESDEEPDNNKKNRPQPPESLKNKPPKGLEKYELTKDEIRLLGLPVELNNLSERLEKTPSRTPEKKEEIAFQEEKTPEIADIFNLALSMQQVHNFENAAALYLQAFSLKEDKEFENYKIQILENLANCCNFMNKTVEAIDFYNNLIEFYSKDSDFENINKTKLKIADIYKKTYKLSHAKVIYENLIKHKPEISQEVLFHAFIELADVEEKLTNIEKSIDYYKEAFSLEFENDENIKDLMAKAFCRYAQILDNLHRTNQAFDYYEKCINASKNVTNEMSAAYTNMAEILYLDGDSKKAQEFYEKALNADIELSNNEGIYYVSLKLAILNENSNPKSTLNWLLKSLSAAKRTKDAFYITSAYLEIGDFYFNQNDYEKSLKAYLRAKKVTQKEEIAPINDETPDKKAELLKNKISPKIYEKIVQEVMKNE